MRILSKEKIIELLSIELALKKVEEGFLKFSQKEAVIPFPSSLHFENPPGDCHIKYGFINDGPYFVVKIATGFPENPSKGEPSGNGLMILFSKKTGAPLYLLQDEGYLTEMRTACAGAIAAKYLAPAEVSCIGMVGTGAQSYYQLSLLPYVTHCREVMIWGRDLQKAEKLASSNLLNHFNIRLAHDLDELAKSCNLIITTTSSNKPLIKPHHLRPGMHITAVGADDAGKQEIDPRVFSQVDLAVVDSALQCITIGDSSYAIKSGAIHQDKLIELGSVIADKSLRRKNNLQITIADLTGVAIQDLQIATALIEDLE